MLTKEQIETVLVSTSAESTGHERIVVAFRDGNDLYIPLDAGRESNQELLDASQLYIREVHNQDEYGIFAVEGHRVISTADRQRLESYVARPISVTTEVLHVSGTQVSLGRLHKRAPGFVAIIDGSERALRALAPALAIADWYGRPLVVCGVTAGPDDTDTHSAVRLQLDSTGAQAEDVVFVAKPDLEAYLFEMMRQGQILVTSAFGLWAADGRLHGMLNGLVRHNAPAIIGIGPNVPSDWAPEPDGPLMICVDDSKHAHHMVDKIEPFLYPPRNRVVVAHISPTETDDSTIAHDVACEINERFGLPVATDTLVEPSAATGIAILASRKDAQLVITHSWHRPEAGDPTVASTSLSAVAHVPCPVVVLSDT